MTEELSKRLFESGVYMKSIVSLIPRGTGRVRNMPTAAHTKEMLDEAIGVYQRIGKEMIMIEEEEYRYRKRVKGNLPS